MRLSRLEAEVLLLARRYGAVSYDRADGAWVYVERFPVPHGWNKSEVEILIDIPWSSPGYPSVAPEWFWTDRDLKTSDNHSIGHFFTAGTAAGNGEYLDRGWGHFCVHLNEWRPAGASNPSSGHNLLSYLNLISMIFHDQRRLRF